MAPGVADDEWVDVTAAASMLGLSASAFRDMAASAGIEVARRGPRPGVRRSAVESYLSSARIRPGEITGGRRWGSDTSSVHETWARRYDAEAGDRPGVAAAVGVMAANGWSQAALGRALGLSGSAVCRYLHVGFPPRHVTALSDLAAGNAGRSGPQGDQVAGRAGRLGSRIPHDGPDHLAGVAEDSDAGTRG